MSDRRGAPMQIERMRITGYKSIRDAEIALGRLNVVIGQNGSGKSNLVSFFDLLRSSINDQSHEFVNRNGGPNSLLHFGPRRTHEIASRLELNVNIETDGRSERIDASVHQRLEFRPPDHLVYSMRPLVPPAGFDPSRLTLFNDHCAIVLPEGCDRRIGPMIYHDLNENIGVYHFIDTSPISDIRLAGYVEDNRRLRSDGGNLAAVLYRLRETEADYYRLIVETIRLFIPFFDDFDLAPNALDPTRIVLNWKQKGSDYLFGPHQLSDGSLRAIALTTLLRSPPDEKPGVLVIDEPELGLHPRAISLVAAMTASTSYDKQIIIATQSPEMLDEFDPEDLICVEREGDETVFHRPDGESLRDWLEDFSLGRLWIKNVIGG